MTGELKIMLILRAILRLISEKISMGQDLSSLEAMPVRVDNDEDRRI